jgi:hypothetical protein
LVEKIEDSRNGEWKASAFEPETQRQEGEDEVQSAGSEQKA